MKPTAHTTRFSAPVFTKSDTQAAEEFMAYITGDGAHDVQHLADAEADRLGDYFGTLEKRLAPHEKLVLSQKGSLSALFKKVATETRNLILSEFIVIPEKILSHAAYQLQIRTGRMNSYFKPVDYHGGIIQMGFVQTMNPDKDGSVTFPVLALDTKMMTALESFDLRPVAEGLQKILSIANHDMLHHLTNTYLNDDISKTARTIPYARDLENFMREHVGGSDTDPGSYESWALLSHAATWREASRSGEDHALSDAVDQCFAAIHALNRDLQAAGKPLPIRAQAIDSFSTIACFGLMRICPLHAPLMERAVEKAAEINPNPGYNYTAFARRSLNLRLCPRDAKRDARFLTAFLDILDDPEPVIENHAGMLAYLITRYNDAAPHCDLDQIDAQELIDYAYRENSSFTWSMDEMTASVQAFSAALKPEHIARDELSLAGLMALRDLKDEITRATLNLFCVDPALYMKNKLLIEDTCNAVAADLHQHVRDYSASSDKKQDLFIATLANYERDDASLFGAKTLPLPALKKLEIIDLAPEIAYLVSPHRQDQQLSALRDNADIIDRGICTILNQ